MSGERLDVLHVPYAYFPDAAGGTEFYVSGLIAGLRKRGISGAVAAPGAEDTAYDHEGVPVHRFAGTEGPGLAHAYGAADETAARSFDTLLQRLRPRIVHLHAHTAAVSYRLADAAHDAGAKVFFTYHTPSASCLRGTMMRMGSDPCDGVLDLRRCTVCTLHQHGVPSWFGNVLAGVPHVLGRALANARLSGGAFTAMRMSRLVEGAHIRFHGLMEKSDRVVAVCQWVADVLRANGVPNDKLALCRQGMFQTAAAFRSPTPRPHGLDVPLRLGYFGRLDPIKGVDILIDAIRRAPHAALNLDVFGIRQPGSEAYVAKLEKVADCRIIFQKVLHRDAILDAMSACDFVVIPSRCLETGPLVAYEAFAAGTPVLGARLGGIAELVRDEVDGVLVTPDDPGAWAKAIVALARDSVRVDRLRAGIRPPRTMSDAAREMAMLYQDALVAGE